MDPKKNSRIRDSRHLTSIIQDSVLQLENPAQFENVPAVNNSSAFNDQICASYAQATHDIQPTPPPHSETGPTDPLPAISPASDPETGHFIIFHNKLIEEKKPCSEPVFIKKAVFVEQPPDNLRKSNFFHFDLSFYDSDDHVFTVEDAHFIEFMEQSPDDKVYRNGIVYRVNFRSAKGVHLTSFVHVRLIDSTTKKLISYDGPEKNPDMCRVLLTHEAMCSRCLDKKSCGNKNETPSNPIVKQRGRLLRFHMKCNQNCLKNAGNPRETRRFKIMIYSSSESDSCTDAGEKKKNVLAISDNMFVHNNSKHGRKNTSSNVSSYEKSQYFKMTGNSYMNDSLMLNSYNNMMDTSGPPIITDIVPKQGSELGGNEVILIGVRFFTNVSIAFGNCICSDVSVINSCVIKVIAPPYSASVNNADMVEVKCMYGMAVLPQTNIITYKYESSPFIVGGGGAGNGQNLKSDRISVMMSRLWKLLPKLNNEYSILPSDELVIKRCIDALEMIYKSNIPVVVDKPPNSNQVDCTNMNDLNIVGAVNNGAGLLNINFDPTTSSSSSFRTHMLQNVNPDLNNNNNNINVNVNNGNFRFPLNIPQNMVNDANFKNQMFLKNQPNIKMEDIITMANMNSEVIDSENSQHINNYMNRLINSNNLTLPPTNNHHLNMNNLNLNNGSSQNCVTPSKSSIGANLKNNSFAL